MHDVGEARDARLDVLQRLDHLGDALAGDVLERAGFEDDHHLLVDQRLVGGRIAGVGGHQGLGAFHDRVGGRFGRLDDGAELLAGRRDAAVLQFVDLQHADLAAHRFDVAGDLAQLAIDLRVHRLEEALQRLRGDLRQRDDVEEGDVLALLSQEVDQAIEMACVCHCHGTSPVRRRPRLRLLCPRRAVRRLPFLGGRRCGSRRPLRACHIVSCHSANTASILVLSVCALNGLTM